MEEELGGLTHRQVPKVCVGVCWWCLVCALTPSPSTADDMRHTWWSGKIRFNLASKRLKAPYCTVGQHRPSMASGLRHQDEAATISSPSSAFSWCVVETAVYLCG